MRLACVFVPQIALQAALRRFPELRGTAVALTEGSRVGTGTRRSTGRTKIGAVSTEARRAGVRTGMTTAQAAAACPTLTLLPLADADLAAAEAALADLGFGFAPRIDREPGRVFFEIGDLAQLYPSEAAVTQAIQTRALRVGLGVRVAVAARKGIARVATRASERALIPTGREAAYLAPLPLRVLGDPLAPETVETFDRWGLNTIGALAKLPPADVGLRLGANGARLHRLARGEDDDPFLPALPADAVEEGVDLDDAVSELEPLSFVLRGIFDRVLARLACRSLACAGITLRFQLESRAFDVRDINLAAPTRETAPLLQLVRLDLSRRPPDAPITAVLVVARPARARTAQLDFLRPAGPAPDRLAATIARLGALCGPDNVGVPRAEDTWREEAVGVAAFVPVDPPHAPRPATTVATSVSTATATATDVVMRALTIRRYRPPEEIEVMWGPNGPSALRGKETTARILVAAGPYRLSGEWWRRDDHDASPPHDAGHTSNANHTGCASGFSRDYWDVHASDGALYRLHHDRLRDRWYLDGYYD
jgi:protein ImuB